MSISFERAIREEINELLATGTMRRAVELSTNTGQDFDAHSVPLYFTGRLDARLVMVHFHPGIPSEVTTFKSAEEYIEYHTHFGKHKYGRTSGRKWKSQFDDNMIRFLKAFGGIEFKEELPGDDDSTATEKRFFNREQVADQKLQLQLIPFVAGERTRRGFTRDILKPYIHQILDVVTAVERDAILFCGSVFQSFFKDEVTEEFRFPLPKVAGGESVSEASFLKLRFDYKGEHIRAGLLPTYNKNGLNIGAYGLKCRELYG